jgi:hypothetical protein
MGKGRPLSALIVALYLGVAGCATSPCTRALGSRNVLEVWHLTGGDAPLVSAVTVGEAGTLEYSTVRGRKLCTRLTAEEVHRVASFLANQEARAVIEQAAAKGTGYADAEELEMQAGDWFVEVPLDLAPPELREFLRFLSRILESRLGAPSPWSSTQS